MDGARSPPRTAGAALREGRSSSITSSPTCWVERRRPGTSRSGAAPTTRTKGRSPSGNANTALWGGNAGKLSPGRVVERRPPEWAPSGERRGRYRGAAQCPDCRPPDTVDPVVGASRRTRRVEFSTRASGPVCGRQGPVVPVRVRAHLSDERDHRRRVVSIPRSGEYGAASAGSAPVRIPSVIHSAVMGERRMPFRKWPAAIQRPR
jgi:hypothetical protein